MKAPRDARAFIGLALRTDADRRSFESVYFRPTNGRMLNPGAPRDKRAIRYFAYPDWKFDRLRRDFPDGRYESGADIANDVDSGRLRGELRANEGSFDAADLFPLLDKDPGLTEPHRALCVG